MWILGPGPEGTRERKRESDRARGREGGRGFEGEAYTTTGRGLGQDGCTHPANTLSINEVPSSIMSYLCMDFAGSAFSGRSKIPRMLLVIHAYRYTHVIPSNGRSLPATVGITVSSSRHIWIFYPIFLHRVATMDLLHYLNYYASTMLPCCHKIDVAGLYILINMTMRMEILLSHRRCYGRKSRSSRLSSLSDWKMMKLRY